MKKLVLTILALIALFSALRAYTESTATSGIALHPGLVEIGDGSTSIGMAFGVMEKSGEEPSTWSLLPLRLVYKSGDTDVTIGLNGLSFLLRGGMTVGRPIRVDTPHTGDVLSIGGKVTVNSRVDGDVWAVGADVELSPRADVTGDVVALGGKVVAAQGAIVRGSVSQVPQIKIPFLGILGTQFSVQVLATGRQLLGFFLFGFALFLTCFYREGHARMLYQSIPASWRESVITLAVALVLIPVVTLLLIVSVIGIFFIPVLAFVVILLALDGFLHDMREARRHAASTRPHAEQERASLPADVGAPRTLHREAACPCRDIPYAAAIRCHDACRADAAGYHPGGRFRGMIYGFGPRWLSRVHAGEACDQGLTTQPRRARTAPALTARGSTCISSLTRMGTGRFVPPSAPPASPGPVAAATLRRSRPSKQGWPSR